MCWTLDASDVRAAQATRRAATAALRTLTSSDDMLGAAELIIGELLSNATRHTDGKVCLELGNAEGHARISVYDSNEAFAPDVKRPADELAENGRGLFIISKLARRMSIHPFTGIGKCVSVTLDLPLRDENVDLPKCGEPWLRHDGGVCLAPRLARYRRAMHGSVEA